MTDAMGGTQARPPRPVMQWIAGIGMIVVVVAVYWLRLDNVVGLFLDDGWYVLLAKALATGQGYSIVNSPTPGILPLYPPAFSFLLSLVFRVAPNFPDNLWLLKTVSILAMVGTALLACRYFTKDRELSPYWAMGIAAASVLSPPLVFLATSTVMSECLFALVFLATIVVVEASVRAGQSSRGWQLALLGGALASVGFLTRAIALSLLLAGVLYLLKARLLKSAIVFAVVACAIVGPWMLYSRAHAPTPEQRQEQRGHIVLPYSAQFWQRRAGFGTSGQATVAELPGRVLGNLTQIAGRDVARIMITPLFEALRDPFVESKTESAAQGGTGETWWGSFLLAALAAFGFWRSFRRRITMAEIAIPLSFGIIALWPWETFRFVLPLVPFVCYYLLAGVRGVFELRAPAAERSGRIAAWATLLVILAANLYGNVRYIVKYADPSALDRSQWQQVFDDAEDLLKWSASHLPPDAVIATNNPPLVHLYTGRKAVASEAPDLSWPTWERLKVRYLLLIPVYFDPVDPAEKNYKTIYQVRHNPYFRVIDLGEPGARPAWGK